MDQSRIIIIGCNGQLGRALSNMYPKAGAVDQAQLNISDSCAVDSYDWSKFDVIINAAAYTNVDNAEQADGRAASWKANAQGPANLARVATKHSVCLVHISSEYVFDGTKDNHDEDELLSPLSTYGATKAAGDIAIQLTPKHYIVRTSWVIGDGGNFVRTMMNLAEKDISPTVVADQIGRLTFTSELSKAIDHLLTKKCEYGLYNVTNSGEPASWADVTRAVFATLGRDDLSVTDTTTEKYFSDKPDAARRPLLSTMNLDKLQQTGFKSTDWRNDLNAYLERGV